MNNYDQTPLLLACKNMESNDALSYIANGININQMDVFGDTALTYACKNGMNDVVNAIVTNLLFDGVNVDISMNIASYHGHFNIIDALKEYKEQH